MQRAAILTSRHSMVAPSAVGCSMSSSVLQTAIRDFLKSAIGDNFRISGLHVDGVEVTQSIQYREADRHLTDPADRGPDNSIRLVADKAARVRVYVRNRPEPLSGVVGTITVQRRRYGLWQDVGPLEQLSPRSVTAEPSPGYAAERSSMWNTLNFVIPASLMRGVLRLRVQVKSPDASQHDEWVEDVDASLLQTLTLRGIPITYIGPDDAGNPITLAPPVAADFVRTAATTLRMFPVSQTPRVTLAGLMTWREPLLGAIVNGACPASWNSLLFWLGLIRLADGNRTDALYYGLFPSGIPIGGAAGCGGGSAGVGAGAVGDGMTMAHELGHVLGFDHAQCGLGAGDAGDPNYPAYEPYDTVANRMASLGEYGTDVTNGTIYTPRWSSDFMSYCGPRWISLYHMARLLPNQRFNPTFISSGREELPPYFDEQYHGPSIFDRPDPPPPWVGRSKYLRREVDPVRLIAVSGVLLSDSIEIRSVIRLTTGPTSNGQRIPGAFVEVLDANLRVLQRTPLRRLTTRACGCGCGGGDGHDAEPPTGLVQALIPDTDEAFTIRVVMDDKEIWTRQGSQQPPVVFEVSAVVDGELLIVTWQSSVSDAFPTERMVRWSNDDGQQWQALAVKLDEDRAEVSTQSVTCGTIRVQVTVSDGFYSTTADPVSVDIPRRAPQLSILWPASGCTVRTDEPVRLWGAASACSGDVLEGESLTWYLDGERVGTGAEVWAHLADYDGEHVATLKADDGNSRSEVSVVFNSNCNGRQPYRGTRGG